MAAARIVMNGAAPLTVVTGATERYARTLWQMLRDAARAGVAPRHRFIAFDLGLSAAWRTRLARDFPWCAWRTLDFNVLPAHVHPAQRTYAWKPLALHAAVVEFGGQVLWLDSATLFHEPIEKIADTIAAHGLYTLAGQSPLLARCEPAVWQALQAPPEALDQPERAAGVIGVDTRHPAARSLVDEWRDLALDPRYWRALSTRHKPEQALLSLLIYRRVLEQRLTLNAGEIDISCATPVRWLSTRNKVAAWLPTAADPLVRAYYAVIKRLDRAALRVRRAKQTRVNGWHRWPMEHYTVFHQPLARDAAPVRVEAPRGSYYADPFLFAHEGRTWLFVEEFRYRENRGRLVALPLDAARPAREAQPLLLPLGHSSFPFVFEHEGEIYLLPETTDRRVVDLYVCEIFPDRWQLRRRLLVDVDAADSVLIQHDGRWWLFTSVRSTEPATASGRALAIFHTADLLTGHWEPHPINAERRYGAEPHSFGRCAGPFVRTAADTLLRPIHTSRRFYGESAALMKIDTLTPSAFIEHPFTGEHPLRTVAETYSPHHVAMNPTLIAWDVRNRVSYTRTLLGLPR